MESWVIAEVSTLDGMQNIPGYSWHKDETLHAQVLRENSAEDPFGRMGRNPSR